MFSFSFSCFNLNNFLSKKVHKYINRAVCVKNIFLNIQNVEYLGAPQEFISDTMFCIQTSQSRLHIVWDNIISRKLACTFYLIKPHIWYDCLWFALIRFKSGFTTFTGARLNSIRPFRLWQQLNPAGGA